MAKYDSPLTPPLNVEDLGLFEQANSVGYSYFDPAIEALAYEKIFKQCVADSFASSPSYSSMGDTSSLIHQEARPW